MQYWVLILAWILTPMLFVVFVKRVFAVRFICIIWILVGVVFVTEFGRNATPRSVADLQPIEYQEDEAVAWTQGVFVAVNWIYRYDLFYFGAILSLAIIGLVPWNGSSIRDNPLHNRERFQSRE